MPGLAGKWPLSPGGIANRRRTATSSAMKSRSNRFSQLSRVGKKIVEKFSRVCAASELLQRQRRVISHLAEGADAHLLEITFEGRRLQPLFAGQILFAERRQGAAEPVTNIALVGE